MLKGVYSHGANATVLAGSLFTTQTLSVMFILSDHSIRNTSDTLSTTQNYGRSISFPLEKNPERPPKN